MMSSRRFYGSKSSTSTRRAPLTLVNARLQETSHYLAERNSRTSHLYSPGDRLQDKDGVSLALSDVEEEFDEGEGPRREIRTPTNSMGSTLGFDSAYATPSRLDFLEPTQSRLHHRQDPFVISHGGRDGGGINFCSMLQEQQAMLQRILESQEALQDKHSQFEAKLAEIEQKCELAGTPSSSPSSDDSSNRKRKRTITRELSVSSL